MDRTDLSELFWARQDSAKMQFTQPDVDFMTGMIGHHAQALIMSSMASVNNASPSIVILTKRIINAQKDEIELCNVGCMKEINRSLKLLSRDFN